MNKIIGKKDLVEYYIFENGKHVTETGAVEFSEDGKMIIPSKNCYGFKFMTRFIKKEKNLLNRLYLLFAKQSPLSEEIIKEERTYYIGEYLDRDQIKERYGKNSNEYGNALKNYYFALVVTDVDGLTFSIYDDYRTAVPAENFIFKDEQKTVED